MSGRIILAGQLPPRLIGHQDDKERVDILNKPISRLEYSQQIAPFANAVNQHEALLSFLMEVGMEIVAEADGTRRAKINLDELRQWGAKRNLLPPPAAPEPPPS